MGKNKQSCLTTVELQSLLSAQTAPEHARLLEHLDFCSICQDRLARLAGDLSCIDQLQRDQGHSGRAEKTIRPAHETELANVMDRMSAKTVTAFTASESSSTSLSFQGLPYTNKIIAGKKIGSYEVLSRLGVGGMSVVFAAHDHVLDRKVAIKFLSSELENSKTARQRFLREAKLAAAVEHDFIVPIYSADEIDGFPFLVMSHIKGQSLQQRIDASGPLAIDEISRIGIQIAKGLGAFHARDLVHRDLKPSNILLQQSDGRVRITDFGLAKCIDDNQLTRTGTVLGTPHYMSPEQALGKRIDYLSDIYGLGAVLYAVTTGQTPYDAVTSLQILNQLREEKPRDILEVKPDTPLWLVEVIEKLMARNPADRYQSAEEIVNALSAGQPLPRVNPPSPPDAPPRANRFSIVATCVAVVCVTAACLAWYLFPSPTKLADGPSTPGEQDSKGAEVSSGKNAGTHSQDPNHQLFRVTINRDEGKSPVFESLVDAVRQSIDGDTIEIEGNGTHTVKEIVATGGKQLTIRAVLGSEPILEISSQREMAGIVSNGFLDLEGLTFRLMPSDNATPNPNTKRSAVRCNGGHLRVTNCRFENIHQHAFATHCISVFNANSCDIRNSEFYSRSTHATINVGLIPGSQLSLENNVHVGDSILTIVFPRIQLPDRVTQVRIRNNTILAVSGIVISPPFDRSARTSAPVLIEAESNLWDVSFVATMEIPRINDGTGISRLKAGIMHTMMRWQDRQSDFRLRFSFFGIQQRGQQPRRMAGPVRLAEWESFWGQTNTGSRLLEGAAKSTSLFDRNPQDLQPGDFLSLLDQQQRPAEAGVAGAQTEFVGPGVEYTNWVLKQVEAQ